MRGALVLAVAAIAAAGCYDRSSYPAVKEGGISNRTLAGSFQDYKAVYATTYRVVNRYAVVKWADYRTGEIVGEVLPDNQFLDKTRRTVQARIFKDDHYYEVEVRVLYEIETSEPETFSPYHPRFDWKVVASDRTLETKLNNEIKLAMTNNGYLKKLNPDDDPYPRVEEGEGERREPQPGGSSGPERGAPAEERARVERAGTGGAVPPGTYEELSGLGLRYFRAGDYALALAAFEGAAQARPGDAFARFSIGHCAFALGRYGEASAAFAKGLDRSPELALADIDLRGFYRDPSSFYDRLGDLEKAVNARPRDEGLRFALAYVSYFTGDYGRARRIFESLATEQPHDERYGYFARLCEVREGLARGLKIY